MWAITRLARSERVRIRAASQSFSHLDPITYTYHLKTRGLCDGGRVNQFGGLRHRKNLHGKTRFGLPDFRQGVNK